MADYTARELREGLYEIDEGMVRSFLFASAGEALLVDTGACGGDLRGFVKTLTDAEPYVLHTHADRDHTAASAPFARVCMHPAEFAYFASKGGDAGRLSPLWEGDRFRVGPYELEAVSIPGHTPGSVALIDRRNRFLLSGDSVSNAPIFMFGEGRSFPAFMASMRKLDALRADIDDVYASHGDVRVDPDRIPLLLEGARAFLAGELVGETPAMPVSAKVYACGGIRFLA